MMVNIVVTTIFIAFLYGAWLLAKGFHELLEANKVAVAEIWIATLLVVMVAGFVRIWWKRKSTDWGNVLDSQPSFPLFNYPLPANTDRNTNEELKQIDQCKKQLTENELDLAESRRAIESLDLKLNPDGSIDYRLRENRGKRDLAESAQEHHRQILDKSEQLMKRMSDILGLPETRFTEWAADVQLAFHEWQKRALVLRAYDAKLRATMLSIRSTGLLSITGFVLISLMNDGVVILNALSSVLIALVVYKLHMWYFGRQENQPDTRFEEVFHDMQKIISTPESALKYFDKASS